MQPTDELLEMDWDGPLAEAGDFPTTFLYGVELSFKVDDGATLDAVRDALVPVLGAAEERKSLLGGRRLEWSGKSSAEAALKRGKVRVAFGTRVKGGRAEEAVRALAALPGARDLRLKATVRRFLPRPEAPAAH